MTSDEISTEPGLSLLDVACPTCEANPGKECTWGVTTVRRFHKARKVPAGRWHVASPAPVEPELGKPVLYARHDPRRLGL